MLWNYLIRKNFDVDLSENITIESILHHVTGINQVELKLIFSLNFSIVLWFYFNLFWFFNFLTTHFGHIIRFVRSLFTHSTTAPFVDIITFCEWWKLREIDIIFSLLLVKSFNLIANYCNNSSHLHLFVQKHYSSHSRV